MIIGLDPGKEPGICIIDSRGEYVHSLLVKTTKAKEFDHKQLSDILLLLDRDYDIREAYMELPHSVFGVGAKSNFTFGYAVGACRQALESRFSTTLFKPKEWQKKLIIEEDVVKVGKKKDTKKTAANTARRLLGDKWDEEGIFIPPRGRVKNHNLIDAYLIGKAGQV